MNQLDSIGGFVASEPVAREITIGDKTETFYFVEMGYAEFRKLAQAKEADGHFKELEILSGILRVGPNGTEQVSYDDVARLKRPVVDALVKAAWEVNGVDLKDGQIEPKN